jgi:hypothetical protein
MPNEYKGETCGGCTHFIPGSGCDRDLAPGSSLKYWASTPACEKYFVPSVECRIARALETLAACCVGPRGGFYVEGPNDQ